MPFGFLRRKPEPKAAGPRPAPERPRLGGRGVPFDGLTEEWRLQGRMQIDGRLSDALNKRESIEISDVSWAPVDGSTEFSMVEVFRGVMLPMIAGSLPDFTAPFEQFASDLKRAAEAS